MNRRTLLLLSLLGIANGSVAGGQVPLGTSPFDKKPLTMLEYPFVTQHAVDTTGIALGKLALENAESMAFAERKVFDRDGRFTVDSAALQRVGYRPMPGLNVRIVTGTRWFVIYADIPRVVSISLTALTATGAGPVSSATLWTWPDSRMYDRKP